MSVGQTIAVITLLSQMYLNGDPLMSCLVKAESGYDMRAVNGIHTSGPQWNRKTFMWLAEKAIADPTFAHREYVAEHMTPDDDLSSLFVMAWAIKNGYGSHWATYRGCGGEG